LPQKILLESVIVQINKTISDIVSIKEENDTSTTTAIASQLGDAVADVDFLVDSGSSSGFIGTLFNPTVSFDDNLLFGSIYSVEKISLMVNDTASLVSGQITGIIMRNITETGNVADKIVLGTTDTIILDGSAPFNKLFPQTITFNFTTPVDVTLDGTTFIGFNITDANGLKLSQNSLVGFPVIGDCITGNTTGNFERCDVFPNGIWGTGNAEALGIEVLISDTSKQFETIGGIQPSNLVVYHTFDFEQANNMTGIINAGNGDFGTNTTFSNAGTFGSEADGVKYVDRGLANATAPFGTQATGFAWNATGLLGGALVGDVTDPIMLGSDSNKNQFNFFTNAITDTWSANFWIRNIDGGGLNPFFANDTGQMIIMDTMNGIDQNEVAFYINSGVLGGGASAGLYLKNDGVEYLAVGTNTTSSLTLSDDFDWHMLSYIVEKSNVTSIATICIDNVCESINPDIVFSGGNNVADSTLFIEDQGFQDNYRPIPFDPELAQDHELDELCIWKGYKLTSSDLTTLFNGARCGTVSERPTGGGVSLTLIGSPPPIVDPVTGFVRTLDNVNQEIDLSWDAVTGATDYVVQRLSTERQIQASNSLVGDNNFATTCIACGDFSGGTLAGNIMTMAGNKVARLGGSTPTNGIFYSGIWLNIVVGGSGIDQIVPEMRGELESTGIMASAGSRLSRDCNSNSGEIAPAEGFRVFSMKQRQDGYTQWHDGTYTDGACIPYARFLGNQLFNLTTAQVADSEITAMALTLNGSSGLVILKEGAGTGARLASAVTGLWSVSDEIESGEWQLNQTFVNITTTSSTSFTDLLVGNWNSYWYRIIPTNLGGEGNPSNILNATLSKPPLRVADLNGTDNGSGTVDLVWTEAEILFNRIGISEDPVQGYLIQRNIVGNETTVYDGLSHDVEEFFLKNDGFVTLATDQASGTGSSPSFSSDKSHGGQMLNITSAVNITRLVIKVGTSGDPPIDFNTEPDLGGAIFFKNGTLVARTIIPRVAMTADIGSWSTDPLDHENFVNWVFSPPVPLAPAEYAFVWSGLGTQNCNSAGCGSGNADVGDYEFFFENTNNGDADGYAIGDIQQNGVAGFGFGVNSVPLNNSKTNDYAMAVYSEDPNWVTIGTNIGVSNTSFSDTSAPIPPLTKSIEF